MTELKKIKLALKYAIRESQELFLLEGGDWKSLDKLINILLSIVEDFGFTKEQVIALYEEVKKEVEKELKND
ncbi:hypothetical protein ES705_11138 [subsurface metagenome]